MCIAYCLGLSDFNLFAILSQTSCTCGTAILFDPSLPGSTNDKSDCGLSPSKSMIGSDVNKGQWSLDANDDCVNQHLRK
jgi:hypothetical protein